MTSPDPSLWYRLTNAEIRTAFRGAVSVEPTPNGFRPWRARFSDQDLIPPALLSRVRCTPGVRLALRTTARAIRVQLTAELSYMSVGERGTKFDLVVNGKLLQTLIGQENGPNELLYEGLPSGDNEVEIAFPPEITAEIHSVELLDAKSPGAPRERLRWVTHGSSITHCRVAASPAQNWPALVAQAHDWDHWNMGYGGQCCFDQIIARTIRDLPANRISLCLGINTHQDLFGPRVWRPAVEGFILTVRDGHPQTPLLIISPIFSGPREDDDVPPCRIGLRTMRRELEEIVATFRARGDRHIHYLDGLKIIGKADAGTMPDELHPNADGIRLMGQRFIEHAPAAWREGQAIEEENPSPCPGLV